MISKKIVFVLGTTLLLFSMGEGVLRIFRFSFTPPRLEWGAEWGVAEDPRLSWSWIPVPGATCNLSRSSFRFNEMGYRGPSFHLKKCSGTIRIVCMGDSVAMGWWVSDQKTYCYQLQQILSDQLEQKVETINAGVMAYTSFQGLHYLQTRILDLKPDIITVSYNWNDHSPAKKEIQDRDLAAGDLLSGRFNFLSYFRIFQLAEFTVFRLQRASQSTDGSPEPLEVDTSGPIRVSQEDYLQNLEKIGEVATANGIVPIFLTEPSGSEFRLRAGENKRVGKRQQVLNFEYNAALKKMALEKGLACVDLVPVFRQEQPRFWDSIHPAAGGHLLIAGELARVIRQLLKTHNSVSSCAP